MSHYFRFNSQVWVCQQNNWLLLLTVMSCGSCLSRRRLFVYAWWWIPMRNVSVSINSPSMLLVLFFIICPLRVRIWHRRRFQHARPHVITSSNGNFFRVTGPLWGEFTGHRWIPLTKASNTEFDGFFFYLRLSKRLSKPSKRRWIETPSRSLWRQSNACEA